MSNSEIISEIVQWYEGIPIEDQMEFEGVTASVIEELLKEK